MILNNWFYIYKLKDNNSNFKYHNKQIYNMFLYWSKK